MHTNKRESSLHLSDFYYLTAALGTKALKPPICCALKLAREQSRRSRPDHKETRGQQTAAVSCRRCCSLWTINDNNNNDSNHHNLAPAPSKAARARSWPVCFSVASRDCLKRCSFCLIATPTFNNFLRALSLSVWSVKKALLGGSNLAATGKVTNLRYSWRLQSLRVATGHRSGAKRCK